MKTHRNVEYRLIEWRTWNNQLCRGYQCSDKKLLDGLLTTSFQTFSEDEMKREIDHYIDNREKLLYKKRLIDRANEYTYKELNYKLD
jgi:uncharacterized protein YpiB (UPF0302 family)